jgi:hypothetical protein
VDSCRIKFPSWANPIFKAKVAPVVPKLAEIIDTTIYGDIWKMWVTALCAA